MGRWGAEPGPGVLQRMPLNNKQIPQDGFLKKDEMEIMKIADNNNNPEESVNRLRAIANFGKNVGRNSIRVVMRRKNNNNNNGNNANPVKSREDAKREADARTTMIALHDACSKKNTQVQVIQYLVAKHPDGAAAIKDGNLPLHTALTHKASKEVVEYLLEAYPEATGVRNKRFKLPIHVALECGATLEVVKLLVNKDKESLECADYEITSVQFQKVWIVHNAKFGMEARAGLPLHTACKYLANLHVIHFLITEYPDAARTKNKDGWLPVHFSCARGAPLQTVQYLMTACPSSLYERTSHYYEYPMHLAAGRMGANIKVVKYIQSRHTMAVTQAKPNEGLYLTYYDEACLQSAPPSVCWFLSDVCAKASKGYAYVSTEEDPYN